MTWSLDGRKNDLLGRYIEDRLEPEEKAEFEDMCRVDRDLAAEARTLREQARLLGAVPTVDVPVDLAASIMDRVSNARPPGFLYTFLFRPRTLHVRLATGLGVAAAVAAIVVLVAWGRMPGESRPAVHAVEPIAVETAVPGGVPASPDSLALDEGPRAVTFSLEGPGAGRVTLVGDFNNWSEQGPELGDEDGDGVWTLEILAKPGRYRYRFLVDGETWISDPRADAHVDDGFGGIDSVRYVL